MKIATIVLGCLMVLALLLKWSPWPMGNLLSLSAGLVLMAVAMSLFCLRIFKGNISAFCYLGLACMAMALIDKINLWGILEVGRLYFGALSASIFSLIAISAYWYKQRIWQWTHTGYVFFALLVLSLGCTPNSTLKYHYDIIDIDQLQSTEMAGQMWSSYSEMLFKEHKYEEALVAINNALSVLDRDHFVGNVKSEEELRSDFLSRRNTISKILENQSN